MKLTHAAQQGTVSPSPALAIGSAHDHYESEADQMARAATNGAMSRDVSAARAALQRQPTATLKVHEEKEQLLEDQQKQSSAASQNQWAGASLELIRPTPAEWERCGVMSQVKKSMADKIAHEYMARNDSAPIEPATLPSAAKQTTPGYKWEPGTAKAPSTIGPTASTYSGGNTPVYAGQLNRATGAGAPLSDVSWTLQRMRAVRARSGLLFKHMPTRGPRPTDARSECAIPRHGCRTSQ